MASTSLLCDERSRFVCEAADVVKIHFVGNEEEFKTSEGAAPDFVHQHFGENETIFGYSDLKIDLYYSACDLQLYTKIQHGETVDQVYDADVKPDPIMDKIKALWPNGQESRFKADATDAFLDALQKQDKCEPYGQVLQQYEAKLPGGDSSCIYSIRWLRCCDESWQRAKDLVARAQSLAFWYIDAAQYTDEEDDKWSHFLLYAKQGSQWRLAGYASIYDFYAYPEHLRPRVAQILVFPPYRQMGHGGRLLAAIYNHFIPEEKVMDITVEDPSDNFIYLRDLVDSQLCSKIDSFAPDKLKQGWSKEMAEDAREMYKIPKKQARRVYEILRLKHTRPNETAGFERSVKARLAVPFNRDGRDFAKLTKAIGSEAASQVEAVMGNKQKEEHIHSLYEHTVKGYRRTLERLAAHGDSLPVIRPGSKRAHLANGTANGH